MAGWRPSYKQRCMYCKKNMVLISNYRQKPVCTQCQMKEIDKPITDPKFKALFDISPDLYEKSSFLRNIKDAYLRYGGLSDKQEEVFKKVVDDLSAGRGFGFSKRQDKEKSKEKKDESEENESSKEPVTEVGKAKPKEKAASKVKVKPKEKSKKALKPKKKSKASSHS